jgi:hypothetical protein
MKLDLTDITCALIVLICGSGLLYLLNPDFQHFVATEIQPEASVWSNKNIPTWASMKTQFMEGYRNGKSAHSRRQK